MWTFWTIIFPFIFMIVLTAIFQQWYLFALFLGFFAWLGILELHAHIYKKKSITNLFKEWRRDPKNKWKAYAIWYAAFPMTAFVIVLHMMAK